jgi:two-component system, OmpR family, alkaline phosphatase synthesis response regulator PhoP
VPKKILIADDDEDILELVKTAFERESFEVVTVSNGSHLMSTIKTNAPDLLLLDVLLPGIDGYSLQLQLAQDETTKYIPVIIMTALPASKTLFNKFEQVKLFLTKPFEVDVLINEVKKILKT